MERIEVNVLTGVKTIVPVPPEEEVAILAAAADPIRLKQAAIDLATAEFEAETAAMTADYSQAEIDSWPTQEAEAEAWTADNASPTPLLDAILLASGDAKTDLVALVLAKAEGLKLAVGAALGRKKKKIKTAEIGNKHG